MFAHVIETATPSLIALLTGSLVIAGLVKGVIGVGMPIVAFPMLSLLVDVQTAVMLLSMPLVLSNIPQALEGRLVAQTLLSLAPVLVGMIPGVWIGVAVLLERRSGRREDGRRRQRHSCCGANFACAEAANQTADDRSGRPWRGFLWGIARRDRSACGPAGSHFSSGEGTERPSVYKSMFLVVSS